MAYLGLFRVSTFELKIHLKVSTFELQMTPIEYVHESKKSLIIQREVGTNTLSFRQRP
jgi:Tfp pilus assembly pilus retraction ATPase PilT